LLLLIWYKVSIYMWLVDGFLHIVKDLFLSYEWLLAAVFLTFLFFTKLDLVVLVLMESLLLFRSLTWDLPNTRGLDCLGTAGLWTVPMEESCLEALFGRGTIPWWFLFSLFFEVMKTRFKWFWCVYYAE